MTENIIIRKANESDLPEVLALINSPEADDGTAMELRDANNVYQAILNDSNYFLIVASNEKGIIAIVCLVIIMQMTHEGTTTGFISDLIISEDYISGDNVSGDNVSGDHASEDHSSEDQSGDKATGGKTAEGKDAAIALELIQYATDLAHEYGCYETIFHNDYQQSLIESSCRKLGFEQGSPSFSLPI